MDNYNQDPITTDSYTDPNTSFSSSDPQDPVNSVTDYSAPSYTTTPDYTTTSYSTTPDYSTSSYSPTPESAPDAAPAYGVPDYSQSSTPAYGYNSTPDPAAQYAQPAYDPNQPGGYGQQPYPQYNPYAAGSGAPVPGKQKATASLIMGIIGIVLCWVPFIGAILGGIGLIMGIAARKEMPPGDNNLATVGFVLSIIALALSAFLTISCLASICTITSQLPSSIY